MTVGNFGAVVWNPYLLIKGGIYLADL